MSRKTTLIESGEWYKGNTHLHTTLSDGKLEPAEAVAVYRDAGYSFTVITDHWYYGNHRNFESEGFLIFAGMEMDIGFPLDQKKGFCHHVTVMSNPEETPYQTGDRLSDVRALGDMASMVDHMNKCRHLCIYAHPNWSHIKIEEYDKISSCIGVEIYNNVCEVDAGCGYSDAYYDRGLWESPFRLCFASDDAHRREHYLGGFIGVKSAALTHGDILEAIRAGSFYASTGPEIHDFYVEDGQAHIECSPCSDICFYTDATHGAHIKPGTTHAAYSLPNNAKGVYATCRESKGGGRAWTQIIKL